MVIIYHFMYRLCDLTCDFTRPVGEFIVTVLKEKSLENALFLGFYN